MDRDTESQFSRELNCVQLLGVSPIALIQRGVVASSASKWLVLPDIISPVAFFSAYSVYVLHLRIPIVSYAYIQLLEYFDAINTVKSTLFAI